MSKELEALENIRHYDTRVGLHEDDYNIIETALKRLELTDKIEEEVNKLPTNKIIINEDGSYTFEGCEDIIFITKTQQKQLKALEIIKEKRVDCLVLVLSQTYIEYNKMCETEKDKLTQEEYDLLKEVLL